MSFKNCKVVWTGINPTAYHSDLPKRGDPAYPVSTSMLKVFGECPARWRDGYEPPESEAKNYGALVDCLALTPDQFHKRYAIRPETYPDSKTGEAKPWNSNSHWCKTWLAETEKAGVEPIKKNDWLIASDAVKRLHGDELIKSFSDAADKQVLVNGLWTDDPTGLVLPVRCLLDYVPRKETEFGEALGDLKTTRNASPRQWMRWSSERGYHIQAAFDTDLYNAATGEERFSWCFVVQENYAPWQTARYLLAQKSSHAGDLPSTAGATPSALHWRVA